MAMVGLLQSTPVGRAQPQALQVNGHCGEPQPVKLSTEWAPPQAGRSACVAPSASATGPVNPAGAAGTQVKPGWQSVSAQSA
jgi:hypothetical protein